MIRETISNGHLERGICELFAYLYNSVGYLNSLDITELSAIFYIKKEKEEEI
jgi:hypothetical protein